MTEESIGFVRRLWARLRGRTPHIRWDDVAQRAIDAVAREAADARPKLAWAIHFGALDIDPRHLAIHYGFDTDADLEEARRNGLQTRLRALTPSQLAHHGYPAAALEYVGIGFASQEDIDRTAGGNAYHYFKVSARGTPTRHMTSRLHLDRRRSPPLV